jgi:hypothetical protein
VDFIRWLDRHNLASEGMLATDPLYTSCYLTNVGSIKMPAPHHHLFEWGNASLFFGIGQYNKTPIVNEEGEIVIRQIMDVVITYDDRVSEGFYGAKAMYLFKDFVEHPEQLEEVPQIPDEIIKELMLLPKPSAISKEERKNKKKRQ